MTEVVLTAQPSIDRETSVPVTMSDLRQVFLEHNLSNVEDMSDEGDCGVVTMDVSVIVFEGSLVMVLPTDEKGYTISFTFADPPTA